MARRDTANAPPDTKTKDEAFLVYYTVQIDEQKRDDAAADVMMRLSDAINEQSRDNVRYAWTATYDEFPRYHSDRGYSRFGPVRETVWFLRRMRYHLGKRLAAVIHATY